MNRSFLFRATACGGPAALVVLVALALRSAASGALVVLALVALVASAIAIWVSTSSRTEVAELRPPPSVPKPPGASELFEAILGTLFDGVIVVDAGRRLLYVNPSARELLDVGDRPVQGRLFSEISRSSQLQEVIERALHGSQQQHAELVLARQRLTLAVSAGPLRLAASPGILIVLHDVTELRRLERMRRDFVSNVSHELKTPLTSIQAYADTLLEGGLADPSHNRTFVERIIEQTDRLRTLIMDLLRLARIESDEVALEIGPVDAGAVIRACLADRAAVAAAKSIDLRAALPAGGVILRAEPEGLRTILDNLIDNAINYTPPAGAVVVAAQEEGEFVCISVTDTGPGIAREHLSRIFERFYRIDRARSRELGGTGLGLAIVKHLTQTFGGRVEVESELNQGSRFMIWLGRGDPLPGSGRDGIPT